MSIKFTPLALGVLFALGLLSGSGCSDKPKAATIYDTQADGAKLIADALIVAQREHKRVFVEFGANWCIWCHRLHELLTRDPEIAAYFKEHFLLVLVDVDDKGGKMHNEELVARYGEPTKDGLPGLVVLEADGKQLKTQNTAEFEADDHYDHVKVMKFLKEWTLQPEAAK